MTDAADELEILHPEREVQAQGEKVIVNEITFLQGLRASPQVQPMIADMYDLLADQDGPDVDFADLAGMFGRHAATVTDLIGMATGKPRAWIEGLGDADGQNLLMTFWSVNRHFFTTRLLVHGAARRKAAPGDQDSPASTPS